MIKPGLSAALLVVGILSWSPARAAEPARPAALELRVMDEAGQPITGAKVELVLAAWGEQQVMPVLASEAGRWHLVFDRDALCSYWSVRCRDLLSAALLVSADGYASVMSDLFSWPGTTTFRPDLEDLTITFPRAKLEPLELTFPAGLADRSEPLLELVLEPANQRTLRLLDDAGKPLTGVTVDSQMYISVANHCGAVVGRPIAERATTGADGRVSLPADDVLLALQFGLRHATLVDTDRAERPHTWIGRLDGDETTLHVRRHRLEPLDLQVLFDDLPAAGVRLNSCLEACGCGACCGPVGETDEDGRLQLEDFYPEEHSKLFIVGEQGTTLWQLPIADDETLVVPPEPRPFVIYLGGLEQPAR